MALIRMKIQVPLRRPYLLRRQRLIDFFLEHQKQKLLLLCAPAGYGKSTLVIDYVSEIASQVCWYSLDEADRDPVVFLRYLTECVHQRFPAFGEHFEQVLEAVNNGDTRTPGEQPSDILDMYLSEAVDIILNELYGVADTFTIVLCGYHIVESQRINTLMLKLLQYLPENGQIIVLSREIPALALSRMAAYQEVAELKTKDLRFTREEAKMFLSGYPGKSFSEQMINTLVQRFDGWIAGIILGMQALAQQPIPQLGSYEDDNSQIFNYLAVEVLEQQREDVQRFLLETSLLPRLSAPLCNALLERENSLDLLRTIEKKGLFVDRLDIENTETSLDKYGSGSERKMDWAGKDAGVSWYYYHDLFRDFLHGRLHALDPERMHLLSLRAAELLLEADEPEEAISYLITAQEYERAVQIIEERQRRFAEAKQLALCEQWLAKLPSTFVEQRLGLLLVHSRALCRFGRPTEALSLTLQAVTLCESRQDIIGLVEALLEQCVALYWLGQHMKIIPICYQTLDLLENVSDDAIPSHHPGKILLVAQTYRQLGIALHHCAKAEEAYVQFLRALELYHSLGEMVNVAQVHENLALVLMGLAEDEVAETHLHEVIHIWSEIGRRKTVKAVIMALNNLAVLYGRQGRYGMALEALREAQVLVEQISDPYLRGYVVATRADIQRDMGLSMQAEAAYAEAWEIVQLVREAHLSFWVAQGRAENHARREEFVLAREWLDKALQFLPQEEQGHAWGSAYLTKAFIAGQAQDFSSALNEIERALKLLQASQWRYVERQAAVYRISLLWKQGAKDKAVDVCSEVLMHVEPKNASQSLLYIFYRNSLELLLVLHILCQRSPTIARPQRERAQWLVHWLQTHALPVSIEADRIEVSSVHQPELQSHPRAVFRIFTLGEPRVYRGETLIAQWRSAKARELLLYFIDCNAPQHKEVVMDALWPEVLLPQADWSFRSTLYRLRRVIGQGCIVYRHGLYELNLAYWFDVREFEAALDDAQQLDANAAQTHSAISLEILAAYKRAISLYGGDYCKTLYADWCRQRREDLRLRYIGAALRLAHIEWDMSNMEESARSWKHLLTLDECLEEAHQGLMTYYVAHSQRVMAVRQYQRCFEALKDLGVSPSAETTSIYQTALSQKVKLDSIN